MMPCMCLCYNWQPPNLPSHCVCSSSFDTDHALTCPTVRCFPSVRHNDLRDFAANLLTEVCPNVCIEPPLQALTGELPSQDTSSSEDGAHLDVSAQGFGGDRRHRTLFDVRVFHPNAPSYRKMQLTSAYSLHECQKQRSYDQRVREIEHGSFTPLVFSTSGGMGRCIQENCLLFVYQARATVCCSYLYACIRYINIIHKKIQRCANKECIKQILTEPLLLQQLDLLH